MATQIKSDSTTVQILERLSVLEVDVAVIKSDYATREDIARMEGRLLKWFFASTVTLAGLSGSLAFLAARFIH